MIRSVLACLVIAGCGGTVMPFPQPEPFVRPCEPRWLTLEDDAMDLALVPEGVVWLEWEYGRVLATTWAGARRQVSPASAAYADSRAFAVAGGRVVWARGDGTVWSLAPGAHAPVQLGEVRGPTMMGFSGETLVVAAEDGLHRFTYAGDHDELLDREVWVMTIDGGAVYAQTGERIVRVPIDGSIPETLVARAPSVTSMVKHGGQLLVTTRDGVFAVTGGRLRPYAPLALPSLIWNLRSAGGRVYFTAGNLIFVARDGAAVPVAIASEMIGDLEIDGPTLYVATREYQGVAAICHDPDGAPVALDTPELACAAGELEHERDALSISCVGVEGERTYALAHHASGTRAWEHGRDGRLRTWYADGTLRSEEPQPGLGGAVRRYLADGTVAEEREVEAD